MDPKGLTWLLLGLVDSVHVCYCISSLQRSMTSKVHIENTPLAFLVFLLSLPGATSQPLSDSAARVRLLVPVVVVAFRELVIAIAAVFTVSVL